MRGRAKWRTTFRDSAALHSLLKKTYDKPHGDAFKTIYRELRRVGQPLHRTSSGGGVMTDHLRNSKPPCVLK